MYRNVRVYPADICPGDEIIGDTYSGTKVIGTVETVTPATWDAPATGTYTSGETFRFTYRRVVFIRIPAPGKAQ